MSTDTPLQSALNIIGPPVDVLTARVRAMITRYDTKYRDSLYTPLSVEEVFTVPILNPDTGAASRSFVHAGKYDGIVKCQGREYLLEHKSTSDTIEDPAGPYWRRLVIDSQVSSYVLANWQDGRKLAGTVYDVVRKVSLRPKSITKADSKLMIQRGEYYGYVIDKQFRLVKHEQEALELFELRVMRDVLDNSQKYFHRKVVPRLDSELLEHANELWDVAKSILEARRFGRHYKNSDACMNYGTPCEYLGVCSGYDTIESDNWERRDWPHEELPVIDGSLQVLTNSRVRCFMSCRRRHYYRYELGVRRRDEETREALRWGTLWHQALEAWNQWFIERNNHGNGDSAANEVTSPADATRLAK